MVRRAGASPVFEFENYRPQLGVFQVATAEYKVAGTLKYGAGVRWIEVDRRKIDVKPRDDDGECRFTAPISLPDYGERRVEVKALDADRSQVGDRKVLVFQRVRDTTREPDSLYSIIVLPLIPDGIRDNVCPAGLYASMQDAVITCPLDESDPGSPPRFNCVAVKHVDASRVRVEWGGPGPRASLLWREHGIDLSICGYARKYDQHWEITVYLVDNETETKIPGGVVDHYLPEDQHEWPIQMNSLMKVLKEAIPRVSGSVTGTSPRSARSIHINVDEDARLFWGQKLCVFEPGMVAPRDRLCNRLAEASVRRLGERGRSEAEVAETYRGDRFLRAVKENQLFVVTK